MKYYCKNETPLTGELRFISLVAMLAVNFSLV